MVRKMRVIILSRPFLFLGHRKGGASFEAPPQPVEKPKVGRRCPQTALRWFAGKVLRHKG